MNIKETQHCIVTIQKMVPLSNSTGIMILIFAFLMFLFLTLITTNTQTFNNAEASTTLGQSIEQFQNNLQASINNEMQSILHSNNISRSCDGNNNISIQSQTNNDGKTSSTVLNSCNNLSLFNPFSSVSDHVNKSGKIVSSQYDLQAGVIINSLFGNWSLTTTDNGKNFNATFIKQPIYYDTTSSTFAEDNFTTNSKTNLNNVEGNINNSTTYYLSNFVMNSIQQQNEYIIYSGKIDVVQEIISEDPKHSIKSNTFKDIDISISIFDNITSTIQFGKQSELFDEFRNIPLVGIVQ